MTRHERRTLIEFLAVMLILSLVLIIAIIGTATQEREFPTPVDTEVAHVDQGR